MQRSLSSSSLPGFELLLQASSDTSLGKSQEATDSPTTRKSKQQAKALLSSSAPSLTSLPELPQLQDVQLKGKVSYFYEKRINNKNKFLQTPFPIFKSQNFCFFRGALRAQFDKRPDRQTIEQIIKQNLKVYKRLSGQPLQEKPTKIDKVFHHTEKEALIVTVHSLQSREVDYHFNFELKVVFGSNTVSETSTANKTSEVFWTIKLMNQVIATDVLIQKNAEKRDCKIEKQLKEDGTPYFKKGEKDVAWYEEYLAILKNKEPEEGEIIESDDEDSSEDWTSDHIQNGESEEDSYLVIADSPTGNSPPRPQRKRRLRVSDDQDSDHDPISKTNKRPTLASTTTHAAEHPLATAQSCAEQIQSLMPSIMRSLQQQSEATGQKETQIVKLKQQVKDQQAILNQRAEEAEAVTTILTELQTEQQRLIAEVTALKAQPSTKELQAQLKEANNARAGTDACYQNAKSQIQELEEKLEEVKKTGEIYRAQLDKALKQQEETRVLLQQAQQTTKDLKESREEVTKLQAENLSLKNQNLTLISVQEELEKLKALYQRVFTHNQQLGTDLQEAKIEAETAKKLSEYRMSQLTQQGQKLKKAEEDADYLAGQLKKERSYYQQTKDTLKDKERALSRAQDDLDRWQKWHSQVPPLSTSSSNSSSSSRQNYRQ